MKNITITMEDPVADWVRVEAAKRDTSISRLVGEWIAEEMRRQDAYEQAKRSALKFETWSGDGATLARDAQYDRPSDGRSNSLR